MKLITAVLIAAVAGGAARAQEDGVDPARRTREKLASLRLDVDFSNAKVADVIAYFQEYSGLNFHLDSDVKDDAVTLKVKNVTLKTALKLVLSPRDLGCVYRNGILHITPKSKIDTQAVTRIYDVRDLQFQLQDFPGPTFELGEKPGIKFVPIGDEAPQTFTEEVLVDLIKTSIGVRSWDEAPGVSITMANGLLVISQNRAIHEEVRGFLDRLRQYK